MEDEQVPPSPRPEDPKICKVVLTGGPCAGKTTAQAKVSEFFENLGWKVFRVPETASVLLPGGVNFGEMNPQQQSDFQENLVKTMRQIEKTFFDLAALDHKHHNRSVLIICDRGLLDPSAYCPAEDWQRMLDENGWNNVALRDERYHHVVHMVSAADGAEEHYQLANNVARSEGLGHACELDKKTQQAWVGHPYVDIIDNSTTFDEKVQRVVDAICERFQVPILNPRRAGTRKHKFLVDSTQSTEIPIAFQAFDVEHTYLITADGSQARIRTRSQGGDCSYQHTIRHPPSKGQHLETRIALTRRGFEALKTVADPSRHTVTKTRKIFLWEKQYFQMDMYHSPARCENLVVLETYSIKDDMPLPDFLTIVREITGEPEYSMYNLSRKEDTE